MEAKKRCCLNATVEQQLPTVTRSRFYPGMLNFPTNRGTPSAAMCKIHVQWEGDRQILIKTPKTGRYRVEKKVGDVNIRYQPYCQNEVFQESISPDRQWTAVAFFGNCNEPIIQALQVAILPSNKPLTNQPDSVFIAETNHLSLIWQGNQTLKIEYLDMGNVLVMKQMQGNIRIEFNRRANSAKPL